MPGPTPIAETPAPTPFKKTAHANALRSHPAGMLPSNVEWVCPSISAFSVFLLPDFFLFDITASRVPNA
jgi:hypothetical protein